MCRNIYFGSGKIFLIYGKNSRKKTIAHLTQGMFLLLAMIVYFLTSHILEIATNNFLFATICIIFNLFVMLIIIYIFQNILITFVKVIYCKGHALNLKKFRSIFYFYSV